MGKTIGASVLFVVACVSDSGQSTTFIASWNCQTTTSVTVTGQSTVTEPAVAGTIIISQGPSNQLTIDDVSDNCTIAAVSSGASASITGTVGQCTQTDGNVTADITYNGGTFVVNGGSLNGNVTAAFTGTASGQPVSGTMAATYACTK